MKDYFKPELYLLGTITDFINGSGNGNAIDYYSSVSCDLGGGIITSETCHNNPNSPVCQYFVGQGYVVAVIKNAPPCN